MSIDESAAANPVDEYPPLAVDGSPPLLGAAEARATIGVAAAGACAGAGAGAGPLAAALRGMGGDPSSATAGLAAAVEGGYPSKAAPPMRACAVCTRREMNCARPRVRVKRGLGFGLGLTLTQILTLTLTLTLSLTLTLPAQSRG